MKSSIMARGESLALTFVLMMCILSSTSMNIVTASPGPTYTVDPPLVETDPGESFTINVNISGGEGVWGWEFKLKWDVDLLEATGATEGSFLKQGGMTYFSKNINNLLGEMFVGCTLLTGSVVDGDGTLASIAFDVRTWGIVTESDLDLYDSNWMDSDLVRHYDVTEVDGYVITGPVPPVADAVLSPDVLVADEPVTFNATYDPKTHRGSYDPDGGNETYPSGIVSYLWDFDDGNNATTTDPVINHTYTEANYYDMNLTVTDDEGESSSKTISVPVHIVDVAIIAVEPSAQIVLPGSTVDVTVSINNTGTITNFESSGTGTINITAYYFNSSYTGIIGNETIEVVPKFNPPAYYWLNKTISWNTTGLSQGAYTIKANVSDPLYGEKNLANNELVDGTVTISQFEILIHEVVVGGVTFKIVTNSSSKVSNFGFSPALREISFDVEGEAGTTGFCNVTIPIIFLNGEFTVKIDDAPLDFTLTQNATHSFLYFSYTFVDTIHKIKITGTTVAIPPVVDFTVSNKNPYRRESIMFNASASYDPDGSIAYYTWDFADGNTTTVTNPIIYHTYTVIGGYQVELKVTDNHGLNNTKKLTLLERVNVEPIHDVSVLEISVSSTTIVAGETVSINITVKNKGDTSESFNVTVSYDGAIIKSFTIESLSPGVVNSTVFDWNTTGVLGGTYLLKAEAELTRETPTLLDDNVKEITLLIQEKPIADFSYTPADPIVEQAITFNASASYDPDGSIANYTWDFGDGITATVTTPMIVHTYSAAGTYNVNLTITDNDGLATQEIMQVSIGKASSTITLTLAPATVTRGENVTLSGQISPVRAGVTVELMYRLGEEEWSTLTTVTDTNGEYFYSWRPEEAGTYEVKASWEGDADTLPHESDVQTLTVNAPPISISIYIAIGIIIAAVAIGLIYKFVLRKPKPT